MKVYVIYDSVAREYSDLICCKNDDVARRMFHTSMKTGRVMDSSEYSLACVGEFDRENGRLDSYGVPDFINVNFDNGDDE